MSSWKTFEEIEAWQSARRLCNEVYRICQYKGLKTNYGLVDQIDRASGSIMDNIAEGFGRGGNREFVNFLGYAKGSTDETLSQLYRIYDRKFISEKEFENIRLKIREINNKIGALIAYLKKSDYKGYKFK